MVCTNDELKHSYKRPGTRSKTSEMSKVTDSLDSVAAQPGQELYLFEGHTPRPVVAHRAQSTGRNGTAEGAPATRSKTSEMSKATGTLDSVAAQPGQEWYLFEGHTPRPVVAHRAQSTGRNGTAEGAAADKMAAAAKMAGGAKLSASKPVLMPKRAAARQATDKFEPMSAIPDDAAKPIAEVPRTTGGAAAMIAAALHDASLKMPKLQQLLVLKELRLEEEATSLESEIKEMLEVSMTTAEGEAGDSGKYEKAAATVENRWYTPGVVRSWSVPYAAETITEGTDCVWNVVICSTHSVHCNCIQTRSPLPGTAVCRHCNDIEAGRDVLTSVVC